MTLTEEQAQQIVALAERIDNTYDLAVAIRDYLQKN